MAEFWDATSIEVALIAERLGAGGIYISLLESRTC